MIQASVDKTVEEILQHNSEAVIIIKSTIPEGHTDLLKSKYKTDNIIFSPEFLREGLAFKIIYTHQELLLVVSA